MIIGIPKELKNRESRVGLLPSGCKELVSHGNIVVVEAGAGERLGINDEAYIQSGAEVVMDADDLWLQADMIIKVKEPIEAEYHRLRPGLTLFTYLHLAAEPVLTQKLVEQKVTAIAYETITDKSGGLPLLKPMSEVAGRMSVQVGAQALQKHHGGKGLLLGGVPGTPRAEVGIIGGGVVGINAIKMALGLGSRVTVLDVSADRLGYLDDLFGQQITTLVSNPESIAETVAKSDLLIGAVLVAGAKAPKLVTREMVATMSPGSVVVDVAIDQGGCIETIRPTTHENPTYSVDGVIHYGVTNIPGDVPLTSTYALTNATLPFALSLANKGIHEALSAEPMLVSGLNVFDGKVMNKAVANACGYQYEPYVA